MPVVLLSISRSRFRPYWVPPLLAAMALGGCSLLPSVGPDYQAPRLELPSLWRSPVPAMAPPASASQRLADWWRQLDDPVLDTLIQRALAANPDLRVAQARVRQARASRDGAVGGYFPTVSGSLDASRSKSAKATSSTAASRKTRTLWDGGFDAVWEIDIFGGTRRAVEAADADLAASQAEAEDARVTLVAEVAQTYVDLRGYQRRLEIARDNLATQTETLQIIEWRLQAGLASSADVEQARTNREQTRAAIPDLENGLAEAGNRMAVLVGESPGAVQSLAAEARPLPEVPEMVATVIPADILRQRPDLVAAERTLAAETARVGQRLAERFPSLSLNGSFGWQAYRLASLGGAGTLARAVGGGLAATLFDGGRLRSAVEVQDAVQEQALISYESSVLTALEEVENALQAYAASRERIDARRAAAQAARNAAQLSRGMYQAGLADFQQVLDTERTLLATEDNLAVAEATRLASLITLYKALGGGWEPTMDRGEG